MDRRSRRFSVALLSAAIVCLTLREVSAQNSAANRSLTSGVKFDRFEYDAFRQLLQSRELTVIGNNFRLALRRPSNTIMVILGDTTKLHAMGSRIYTFYKKGGALLVANDQNDKRFLFDFRTYFNAGEASFGAADTLRDFSDCPLVRDFEVAPVLFENVESIATNRPGYLTFMGDAELYTAAWLPASRRGVSESFLAIRHYKALPGRLLAVADHSVFTNQMMMHGSNLTFTNNVIDWLCAGEDRQYLIFIRDGEVMPKYQLGSQLPPIPPEVLTNAMASVLQKSRPNLFDSSFREFTNNAIQSMQARDVFNYAVRNRPRMRRSHIRRGAVIGLAALFLSSLIVRMVTTRRRDPVFKVGQARKQKDHSATARLLIRDFFISDNLTERPNEARPVAIATGWWTRRKLQRTLRRLWRSVTTDAPSRTTAKQLESLRKKLHQLNELRCSGQLRIQWEQ